MFDLFSDFKPTGDQPQAIEKLSKGADIGLKNQVLLGVTGSGKTFTMANIIKNTSLPALVISHNKTLAGQLYQEFRDFFPHNAVSYFVSYYDYYQPEAYIAQTDTYIEKEAEINELIDKLRLQATANILTRKDVIVVASVSCIYNIGSPKEYRNFTLQISEGDLADWNGISMRLVDLLYDRSEFEFKRGTFRLRGDYMDIYPAYEDFGLRLQADGSRITKITRFEPLTGKQLDKNNLGSYIVYPAKHYLTDRETFKSVEEEIRKDLEVEYKALKKLNKNLEAERVLRRVNYDLEMIKEVVYVNGIENYSRYFDGRNPGDPPYALLDYFREAYGDNYMVFIDESHMTVPQLNGMFNGDHSRKKTLIEYGFRLKAAFDNRPLRFEEFYKVPSRFIYVSATPAPWEVKLAQKDSKKAANLLHSGVVEQLIRPTGILDPKISIRPSKTEVEDLINEIEERVKRKERVLVTTLTKKMAEDLSEYLSEKGIKATYLHSDIQTLERSDILDNLRQNEFDVLIGVNLLREGLDLPEVTLVAILDADKEGFLRSRTSLIQTMGRAARNILGEVIIYADTITGSIKNAVSEIERRRRVQENYNKKYLIKPKTIYKPIRSKIIEKEKEDYAYSLPKRIFDESFLKINTEALTPYDKKRVVKRLEREMRSQADDLNFELAIKIRDKVRELKSLS